MNVFFRPIADIPTEVHIPSMSALLMFTVATALHVARNNVPLVSIHADPSKYQGQIVQTCGNAYAGQRVLYMRGWIMGRSRGGMRLGRASRDTGYICVQAEVVPSHIETSTPNNADVVIVSHPPVVPKGWELRVLSVIPAPKAQKPAAKLTPSTAITEWSGRSGEAEARADIAAGRPVKLFYRSLFGERQFIHTPGLSNCNPDRYDVPNDMRSRFVPIDADYSESVRYTLDELARLGSGTKFATAYNVTWFNLKRREVLKVCPRAKLD